MRAGAMLQNRPHLMSLRAGARSWAGRTGEALPQLDDAVALGDETGEGLFLPHVHLVRARVLDALGETEAAAEERAGSPV